MTRRSAAAGAAAALLVTLATAACPAPPATAPATATAAAAPPPAHPEAIPECSPPAPPLRKLVFETRIDRCGPDLAAPILRGLDDLGASEGWLLFTGKDADVAALRGLGCPTAVHCTDGNLYAAFLEKASAERRAAAVREARAGAIPPIR